MIIKNMVQDLCRDTSDEVMQPQTWPSTHGGSVVSTNMCRVRVEGNFHPRGQAVSWALKHTSSGY